MRVPALHLSPGSGQTKMRSGCQAHRAWDEFGPQWGAGDAGREGHKYQLQIRYAEEAIVLTSFPLAEPVHLQLILNKNGASWRSISPFKFEWQAVQLVNTTLNL
jgi:hypothetical protein